jgi:hypothetical protein
VQTTKRDRGLILIVVAVLVIAGGAFLRFNLRDESKQKVTDVDQELSFAYESADIAEIKTAYDDAVAKNPGSAASSTMFPEVDHASLVRATFPAADEVRAVYEIDVTTGERCVVVDARGDGDPSTVTVSETTCP